METQDFWQRGLTGGRPLQFPRWREVEPDGRWSEWWDEDEGLYAACDWPDEDGGVGAGEQSVS